VHLPYRVVKRCRYAIIVENSAFFDEKLPSLTFLKKNFLSTILKKGIGAVEIAIFIFFV